MSVTTYRKNDDLESGTLDKMTVFQNCIAQFNLSNVSSKRARALLTKLLALIYKGETFPEDEATQLFFTITKLFQKENAGLRQMVYVAIKELTHFTDNVIMGTSVLMKDAQSAQGQVFRPNALRALARIIDGAGAEGIDRLMRTAIVDKEGSVSSAALVSAYHLLPVARDTVRRWTAEATEALQNQKMYLSGEQLSGQPEPRSSITQYHALGLLYHLRLQDRMALIKMIQQLGDIPFRSPQSVVLLIRFVTQIIDNEPKLRSKMYGFLQRWLHHSSDMVEIEAAKAILSLRNLSDSEAAEAIGKLQVYLNSPRAVSRFAAIRILNRFALKRPDAVSQCNNELEQQITDSNRDIATYAMTALLKTGSEKSVDRLIDQITGFMDNMDDDFKVVIIDAIRGLALRFPSKHGALLKFLDLQLTNEGGLPVMTAMVDALFDIVRFNKESCEAALNTLSEFIEDCEYPELTARVLHLLGAKGPQTSNPAYYVRYIYNRIVLENSVVRAAAVNALAMFALVPENPCLRLSVVSLLRRSLSDPTDEVRDRAAFALGLLNEDAAAREILAPGPHLAVSLLEAQLLHYVSDPGNFSTPFDATGVPKVEKALERPLRVLDDIEKDASVPALPTQLELPGADYSKELAEIPDVAKLGPPLKSTGPRTITESGLEYEVQAIVHVWREHVVLQYNVQSTYDAYLSTVVAQVDTEEVDGELTEEFVVPLDELPPEGKGTLYVCFSHPAGELIIGELSGRLRYILKETLEDDGQEDEYELNPLALLPADYTQGVHTAVFARKWDELSSEAEATKQFSCQKLEDAVAEVVSQTGLQPVDETELEENQNTYTLELFGRTIFNDEVAAKVRLVRSSKAGVVGKMVVRSTVTVANVFAAAFA